MMNVLLSLRRAPRLLGLLAAAAIAAASPPTETLTVPGLRRPVRILRDTSGIAHIYAENQADLFFAQGYNVAADRLFQLEMWRRQATGTTAEIWGRRALKRDIGARLLKYRGDLGEELDFYHPQGREIIESFVAGINAYVGGILRDPGRLPLEFRVLDIKPGLWTPDVVVSRHNGLFRNIGDEIGLARALQFMPGEKLSGLLDLHPGQPALVLPDGLRGDLLTDRILELYREARAPIVFDERPGGSEADPAAAADIPVGSNNWAVSGRRTKSGSPLLANDPHRALQIPSLRYWVHLAAPGWNVVGGGEPALPGVSIGHNEHGAWGLTIFATDQEDLCVYETRPDDPDLYRFGNGWRRMAVRIEEIPVKGEPPHRAALKHTVHGPVLYEDRENHKAYALRAAWLEPGCAPYLASLRMDQARSWEEFREACLRNRTPAENMVWAGRAGEIGWQVTGLTPKRGNWNGLLPVPGDGRFEWDGFVPAADLPSALNPAEGFLATANQDNIPEGYPRPPGFSWADPFRHLRIREALGALTKAEAADMTALQQDVLSLPARGLLTAAADLEPEAPRLRSLLDLLRRWDGRAAPDSAAAALAEIWLGIVKSRVDALDFPKDLPAALPGKSLTRALRRLKDLGPARDELLTSALAEADGRLTALFGADPAGWRYGDPRLHHIHIRHPLGRTVDAPVKARLDTPLLPRGGNANTVNATGGPGLQTAGASFRIVCDLADWDLCLGTNMPGQSGDPDSPHYADLFRDAVAGRYFRVPFSRAAVAAAAERILLLEPAGR